jgi:hypothetical protein
MLPFVKIFDDDEVTRGDAFRHPTCLACLAGYGSAYTLQLPTGQARGRLSVEGLPHAHVGGYYMTWALVCVDGPGEGEARMVVKHDGHYRTIEPHSPFVSTDATSLFYLSAPGDELGHYHAESPLSR